MNESHLSSPFLRKNVSVTVILDACEGKVCKSKSKREDKKRRFSSKDWIINEEFLRRRALMLQDVLFNGVQDASFVPAAGLYPMKTVEVSPQMKEIFPGTNIDSAVFEFVSGDVKEIKCSKLKNPKYFKIETLMNTVSVDSEKSYDRILSFFDKEKGVPIMVNFFAEKVLKKSIPFFSLNIMSKLGENGFLV
ncbi:MAG: hypothetical protein Ct9H300mP28_23380 [Pseudomonadota bacterium]|nr:MAG: hypothetical protein Ct9H300mP28_23380 [Pseudomonadota bacterium]